MLHSPLVALVRRSDEWLRGPDVDEGRVSQTARNRGQLTLCQHHQTTGPDKLVADDFTASRMAIVVFVSTAAGPGIKQRQHRCAQMTVSSHHRSVSIRRCHAVSSASYRLATSALFSLSDCRLKKDFTFSFSLANAEVESWFPVSCFSTSEMAWLRAAYSGSLPA
jgi:hypothetical protein